MAQRPLLLGHRGARKYASENTLAGFRLALDHGCDGFEFDVRLTSDGVAVVCHDPKHKRLEIAKQTSAELLKGCPEIPRLDAVLQEFARRGFLNVELKVQGAEKTALTLLKSRSTTQKAIISSFLPEVVEGLYQEGASSDLGIICETQRQLARWKALPIDAVILHRSLVNASQLDALKGAGKRVFVWTVNTPREMTKFAEMGVDGLISDDTKLLVETIGR
jgi:glycerophosphoryl diester phosphodiesterase